MHKLGMELQHEISYDMMIHTSGMGRWVGMPRAHRMWHTPSIRILHWTPCNAQACNGIHSAISVGARYGT